MSDSLSHAVDAGLNALRNLAVVDAVAGSGHVEDRLRAALATDHPDTAGHTAARVACAHLAAGNSPTPTSPCSPPATRRSP